MKIETASPSKFLQQRDVIAAPLSATIKEVRLERLTDTSNFSEDVYIVYFVNANVKALKLSAKINRTILVRAFGDNSETWAGKQVEIYHDPNVPNPRNPDRPGGIRVRIPVAPVAISPATDGHRPAASSAPNAPPAPEPTLEAQHARTLAAFAAVSNGTKLDEWARWASQFGFDEAQQGQLDDAYRAARERIAVAGNPRSARVAV